jgi:hypothetical protein
MGTIEQRQTTENEMQKRYLTNHEVSEMAEAAIRSYEFAASWRDAGRAAREFAADEMGVRATDAQVATAVRIAQAGWEGIKIQVSKALS